MCGRRRPDVPRPAARKRNGALSLTASTSRPRKRGLATRTCGSQSGCMRRRPRMAIAPRRKRSTDDSSRHRRMSAPWTNHEASTVPPYRGAACASTWSFERGANREAFKPRQRHGTRATPSEGGGRPIILTGALSWREQARWQLVLCHPLYSLTGSIVSLTGGLFPSQSNVPFSVGLTRTNLPFCTCMPTRQLLGVFAPMSVPGGRRPPAS